MSTTSSTELLAAFAGSTGAFGVRAGLQIGRSPSRFAAYGLDDRSPECAMGTKGRFRIGSVTKTFTSALVLGLVGDGRLGLDDGLSTWLPDYPQADDISVRQLLIHTAGTADPIFDDFDSYLTVLLTDTGRRFATDEVVAFAAALAPFAEPGSTYRYSNTDFHLLAAVVERVTSTPYEACLDALAGSCGLTATSMIVERPSDLAHGWFDLGSFSDPLAEPHRDLDVLDLDNTALLSLASAAGGATSDLDDLLRWGRSLYLGDALDAPERAALLASPTCADTEIGGTSGFGLYGFGDADLDGNWPAYGHIGNIVGSSTALIAWPRHDAVAVIHANIQEISAPDLVALATDLMSSALDEC